MRGLIILLLNNRAFLLFLALEAISLFLVVQFNAYQNKIYFSSANLISGLIYDKVGSVSDFISLSEENERLRSEVARLRGMNRPVANSTLSDSLYRQADSAAWSFIPARVISNSVSRQNNMITIDRGKRHGVEPGLGVTGHTGVVGIVVNVSEHYATIMSLLHSQASTSAAIKRNGFFGNLVWSGRNPKLLQLTDVPIHAPVEAGDTIVTSGYSLLYPEGIPIGIVKDIKLPQGEYFFKIDVELLHDLSTLNSVFIALPRDREELKALERS